MKNIYSTTHPISSAILGLLIFTLLISLMPQAVLAQSQNGKPITSEYDSENLRNKIEALTAREGLDEGVKTKTLKYYQSALDNLTNIGEFNFRSENYQKSLQQAPDRIKNLQNEIKQTQQKLEKQKIEDFSHIPIEELEQRLIIEKGKISNLDQQIKRLDALLAEQNNRPKQIRQETVEAKRDLDATRNKLEIPPTVAESKLEIEARHIYLKTLIEARTAELKKLEIEAASNPLRTEAIKSELQLLDMQKNLLTPVIAAIESTLSERRQQEAKEMQKALDQAEQELADKHPVLQLVTRENIQYSRDLQAITTKIEQSGEQKNQIDSKSAEIETDFKSAERKISLAGLSPALGKILREQRRNLPTAGQFSLQSQTIQDETAQTGLAQFKVEDRLKELADIDLELHKIMDSEVDSKLPANERMMIQAELRVLLNNQKDLLNRLSVAYTAYLRTLGDLDFARQQMLSQAEKFAAYLDERLLWVPSSAPIDTEYLIDLFGSFQWLLSPLNWLSLTKDIVKAAISKPLISAFSMIILILLVTAKSKAKLQLTAISTRIGKIYTDKFSYTLIAMADIFVLALPLPLLIFLVGWLLTGNSHVTDFSQAIGAGLQAASIPLLTLSVFYRLFAPEGVAQKHFLWKAKNAKIFRKQIAWVRFFAVPSVFLTYLSGSSAITSHSDNLSRLAIIILMLSLAAILFNILRPSKGVLQDYLEENPNGWLYRSRYIWYPAAIIIPLTIIGFAAAGYYLSALELQNKLILTFRMIFINVVIYDLVLRWLTLANRQLALKNARQKRKTAAAQSSKPTTAGSEDNVVTAEEELLDIPKINAQTKAILKVFISFTLIIGSWMIWRNILPAFAFLDNITLWQHLVMIDNQEAYQPITLTNLFLAGLYAFIVGVAIRNFPGVMELLIFRRITVDAGFRYAVNHLAKYLLISIGFIVVANELGGSWSQVQWLVAALSLGLGFGLQEIFANMVSGIIILFERPIRVGDTVTISDISGKVSRIQMRATTITDWDQKELIVPNKAFITEKMINWTLTDPTTRVVIPIGIAYGSDIELAHKIMLETVRSTPLVLQDPEPSVLMLGFGDSSLDFSIRVYVSELAHRLPVTHDIHFRIDHAFREHNIEIPFPQRDIHVRSIVERPTSEPNPVFEPNTNIPSY
ncbi:MAG: mechanosensitive ion channel protein MscS [Gammaproteobacteria bacterium HGW-Gammaproteobacteria-10]|nr:MAG: mechanosensitive ion channel protein MscS [Gammaproteobacteria bacterium HGW-Gammaproteobacteria-10]